MDFRGWITQVEQDGPEGGHRTKLDALGAVIESALTAVEKQLVIESAAGGAGDVYESCRLADRRIGLLRRLWRWYADPFDQRRDPRYRAVLAAADEVVWSCWREVCVAGRIDPPPAPVPYVAATDVAFARPRDEVPNDLRGPADPLLARWTKALPIPLVGLPPIVLQRPWWLIVAAHETGHHLLQDLPVEGADSRLTTAVAEVSAAAAAAGADDGECETWELWTRELFADAVSIALCGVAPAWALVELEFRPGRGLLRSPAPSYPPPLVRWAMADRIAEMLLGTTPGAGAGYEDLAATSTWVQDLLARVPAVAAALLAHPIGVTSLGGIGRGTPGWQRRAVAWREDLLAGARPLAETAVESARLCLAGGVFAWQRAAARAQDGTVLEAERLADRLLDLVPRCRAGGVRAVRSSPAAQNAVDLVLGDLFNDELLDRITW